MAIIIPASDLQVGDVYRSRGSMRVLEADAYLVTGIRTVKTVQTYEVIEGVNLRTGLAASINLFRDVEVAQLAPLQWRDMRNQVEALADGEQLHIVKHDGMFWS